MNVLKGVADEARRQLVATFAGAGFDKHGRGTRMIRILSEEVFESITIETITHRGDGIAHIGAFVGISHTELQRTIRELKSEPFVKFEDDSYADYLCYLMPANRYITWDVSAFEDIPDRVRNLFECYRAYGEPFVQSHANLEAICQLMKAEKALENLHAMKWPVALQLTGRSQEAREYVEERLAAWENETHLAARQYVQFAHRFLERFG
jgi:hypothetical protein